MDEGKALNSESMITSGMNEVLTLYTGAVRGKEDSDLKHTPLLTTGDQSGLIPLSTLVDISRGRKQLNQALSPESQVPYLSVAVAIEGKSGSATSATATSTTPDEQDDGAEINSSKSVAAAADLRAVYVADTINATGVFRHRRPRLYRSQISISECHLHFELRRLGCRRPTSLRSARSTHSQA